PPAGTSFPFTGSTKYWRSPLARWTREGVLVRQAARVITERKGGQALMTTSFVESSRVEPRQGDCNQRTKSLPGTTQRLRAVLRRLVDLGVDHRSTLVHYVRLRSGSIVLGLRG